MKRFVQKEIEKNSILGKRRMIGIIPKVLSLLTVVGMVISGTVLVSHAAKTNIPVYIPSDYVWTADFDNTDSRSGAYNTVYARCTALSPTSGSGFYSMIKVRVTNGYDFIISDTHTLNKLYPTQTTIALYEGYYSTDKVGFEFRGNTSNDAYATVNYDGR